MGRGMGRDEKPCAMLGIALAVWAAGMDGVGWLTP